MRITHKRKPILNQYTMGGHILEEVKSHPYFGVELSSDMSWNKHINQISTKANRFLVYLGGTCPAVMGLLNLQLILPWFVHSWNIATQSGIQQSNKDTIEKVQRRAARFVSNDYSRKSSVTKMLTQLEWDTLETRRTRARLHLIYKETHGLIPSNIAYLISNNQLRAETRLNTGKFIYKHIFANKNCYQKSLYPKTLPAWNLLPETTRCAPTLQKFKDRLLKIELADLYKSNKNYM